MAGCRALLRLGCRRADLSGVPLRLRESLVAELLAEYGRFPYRLDCILPASPERPPDDGQHDDGSFTMLVSDEEPGTGLTLLYSPESLEWLADADFRGPLPGRWSRFPGLLFRSLFLALADRTGCGRRRGLRAVPRLLADYAATGVYAVTDAADDAASVVRGIIRHEVAHLRDMQGQFEGTETTSVPLVSLYSLNDDDEMYAEAYAAGRLVLACDLPRGD